MADTQVPKTARQRGKIAPAKFAHCVLRTKNFTEMVRWYKTVLEAEAMFENPMLCFMTYDEEHHRIAIAQVPFLQDRPDNCVGVDHIAFTYAKLGDLIHTYERLKAEGILPVWKIHHGPTISMYYQDPDRNQVELQIDVFDSLEEQDRFLRASDFDKNPIGVMFDPDELAKKFHEGVPEAELKKQPEGPMPGPADFPIH